MREMAFLTRGLRITLKDEREDNPQEQSFCYEGGIREFVTYLNHSKKPLYDTVMYFEGTKNNVYVEVAMQHNDSYTDSEYSFVNNINTPEGGMHLVGFRNAVTKTFNEYARKNKKDHVSIVTKANIIKTTDGKFLRICEEMAKEYPEIRTTEWFIDIMTAKLVDEKRRTDFKVFVLPNLYGDIITDEAAEFQGGVGTAGSANIGKRYAMFEAIHGSAPRMVTEGRDIYADPCSMLRASVLLLSHIGYQREADALEAALDFCMFEDAALKMTGRDTGATCDAFTEYVMANIKK
jgi:isocitrate/isopropylmalate dehydrogenase